jgi:NADH-ubiquinone oxidoreductase chain 5
MIVLVLSPNLIRIIFGWEGLGLVSFILVIFYQNNISLKSGLITIFINRLGDIFLIFRLYFFMKRFFWDEFFIRKTNYIIIFFLFIAAITKRAQFPFSVWLPAAIAAPTPVRSLVHSSTLVTAGIYLIIRFFKIIIFKKIFFFIGVMGLITIFFSGLLANLEMDFKKIIAISTLSQLGLILFSLSIGLKNIGFLHIITHALFKSMLFLSCGSLLI